MLQLLDPIFNDANSGLDNILSKPNDTSFVKENYPDPDVGGEFSDANNEEQFDDENPNLIAEKNTSKILVVKPHQKPKSSKISNTSYEPACSWFESIRQMSQMEFGRSCDQAERNRKHELQMTAIAYH